MGADHEVQHAGKIDPKTPPSLHPAPDSGTGEG
jgi:hypothetical protein